MRRLMGKFQSPVKTGSFFRMLLITAFVVGGASGEPATGGKVLGSDSCSTSGCHGGAGLNRGAHTIWKNYDPHFASAATLDNGRSRAMAGKLGIDNPAISTSCTSCHAPNRQADVSMFANAEVREKESGAVSCANCHGGAKDWLLSHTRPEYPRNALARLGMRQLESPYQRANNCVACHQNLDDDLVAARHPPLVFELDGLLVAEGKHWREDKDFSHAKTWLVGQAVALREAAAQNAREPGERRQAEIAAISDLLRASGTGWSGSPNDLVKRSDEFAKRISAAPMTAAEGHAMLSRLLANRRPFEADAFEEVSGEYRMWARGYYAERLAFGLDRLNEAFLKREKKPEIDPAGLNELFDAAVPPKAFDAAANDVFLEKLDRLSAEKPTVR